MKRPDEIEFCRRLWGQCDRRPYVLVEHNGGPCAEGVAGRMGMSRKRANYLLKKWPFWEFGITARFGWFTREPVEVLMPERPGEVQP